MSTTPRLPYPWCFLRSLALLATRLAPELSLPLWGSVHTVVIKRMTGASSIGHYEGTEQQGSYGLAHPYYCITPFLCLKSLQVLCVVKIYDFITGLADFAMPARVKSLHLLICPVMFLIQQS